MERPPFDSAFFGLIVLFVLAGATLVFARQVVLRILAALIKRSPTLWDDALLKHGVLHRLALLLPPIIVHQGLAFIPNLSPKATSILSRVAIAVIAVVVARTLSSALTAVNAIYSRYPQAKDRPIKGLLQVAAIVGYLAASIIVVAALVDRSPLLLLSGLGALTAIALLVFRDSLLSLVAGVQITTNGLIRVGDWIEMPQFSADGDVIDIALNTIQVQNWDKTITSIPTHKFLENSFKNWRGMQESGGRRIKRSISIDVSTIRFLTPAEVDHFSRFVLLRDYISQKKKELEEYNRQYQDDPELVVNVRRLTNVGTLRMYVINYLRQHPGINQGMTFLVRQLQPTAEGLPLEIYVFTNDVRWAVYETTQADIFDHILAVAPAFGLRIFQNPSGHDMSRLAGRDALAPRASFAPRILQDEEPPASAGDAPAERLRPSGTGGT